MRTFKAMKLGTIWMSLAAFVLFGFHNPGWTMLVPSEMAVGENLSGIDRAADLQQIQKVLENKMVSQRMKDMGLSEQEVTQRLAKLSDQEVHQVASQMNSILPGGDVLGAVVVLLVITFLVLLIIYLAKRV